MESLSYKIDNFEGPLDLLLQLIAKHKLNIYDISISALLEQYLAQLEIMKEQQLDIQSEFLQMASRLIYIKTLSLLPSHNEADEMKEELTGLLIEYKNCQEMAKRFDEILSFDAFERKPIELEVDQTYTNHHSLQELLNHYLSSFGNGKDKLPPPKEKFNVIVNRKVVSVSSKVIFILKSLRKNKNVDFNILLSKSQDKSEIVATFLALLELLKAGRITMQENNSSTIFSLGERNFQSNEH